MYCMMNNVHFLTEVQNDSVFQHLNNITLKCNMQSTDRNQKIIVSIVHLKEHILKHSSLVACL